MSAPEAQDDVEQPTGSVTAADTLDPSLTTAPAQIPTTTTDKAMSTSSTMLSTRPASTITADAAAVEPLSTFDDIADNRSSSLSEIGDASDDQSEATPRPATALDMDEDDSEAETERLESTPRKLTRAGTDTSLTMEALQTRTPSKLVHSKTIDQEDSDPPTPSINADDAAMEDADDADNPLHSLSLVAATEAANLEYVGKKRKRPSAEGTPVEEEEEERARKRSGTQKSLAVNGRTDAAESVEQADAEEELETAEERLSQLAQEELDLEERQANIATETIGELATVAKHTKPRKGGRRGKRKAEDTSYNHSEQFGADTNEVEGEEENEEENSAALDEEVTKKKNAIDELAKIERKFKLFREKLCDEQIAQHERELDMLRQPICVHPEYLAMVKCVDDRRAEKMAYESRLLEYKQKNLETITTAERHQMHSQYFQTVRHIREEILEECNQRVFELQRGRRSLGCDETEYMIKLPEKRSDQIRHQTVYNLEVSILSGVAKYVGFPAAPDISAARPTDVDEDLRAMKIATRPVPPPSFRTYNRTTTADEAAAEEQFLESTPWANPRHPSHQEARYGAGASRVPSYQTPAGQRRVVDLTAPNGSASTIEANSNPPSSNLHPSARIPDSESPVLQMKRQPIDHAYAETPGSQPRNHGPPPGRDSYAMLSSPAAQHMDMSPDQPQRWGGNNMRPLNAALSPAASELQDSSREPRVPMAHRNGLGAVSVGSGSGLFGR